MADLQVVFLRDIMPIIRVEPLDSDVPSLRITGRNFTAASTVLVNGIESPLFLPINDSQVVAEIPSTIVGDLVRSVAVLSSRATTTDRSVITFRITGSSRKVRGIQRLIQRFVLMILTVPGSDLFNPQLGGGLMNLVGRVVSTNQVRNIQSAVQQIIAKAESDLKSVQSETQLDPSETLAAATLSGVVFDPSTTTLAVRVQVQSASGEAAVASLFV